MEAQMQHYVSLFRDEKVVGFAAQAVRLLCAPTARHSEDASITDPAKTNSDNVAAAVHAGALEAMLEALQRSAPAGAGSMSELHVLRTRKEVRPALQRCGIDAYGRCVASPPCC
jgi:hypothetical protein